MPRRRPTVNLLVALALVFTQTSGLASGIVALAQAPPSGTEKRDRGIGLYRQAKFGEALKLLQMAVKENRSDSEGWYYLGCALLTQPKRIKDASRGFEKAIELRPQFAEARAGLAYTYLRRNKPSEAVREAYAALNLNPSLADAHYIIGVVRLNSGEPKEALAEARKAIELYPELASAYLLKSQALVSIFAERASSVRSTTPLPPPTPEQKAERHTRRLETAARFKEAAESLETYLRLSPTNSQVEIWREQFETLNFYASYTGDKNALGDAPHMGDEVTVKARVLKKPEPAYTEQAREAQVTGTVVLRAVFSSDGTVRHILVLAGLPFGLTERAVKAAQKIKFTPATIDGRPASMFVQIEYNFNLY